MADHVLIEDRVVGSAGSRVHYLTAGSGPPLVLLHGGGECALAWRWVLPELARRFRVIAPDFPGSGASDRPPAGYSAAMLGEFVGGFLDALKIPRAAVAGHSLGGLAAMQFALRDPARVSALALVASAGLGREIHPCAKEPLFAGIRGLGDGLGHHAARPIPARPMASASALSRG